MLTALDDAVLASVDGGGNGTNICTATVTTEECYPVYYDDGNGNWHIEYECYEYEETYYYEC